MKNKTVPLLILTLAILACTNTANISAPVPTSNNPSQKLDTVVQLVVTAEIGVQVRSACGVNNPTTGIILTRGAVVISNGKTQELPDGSIWQPIEGGCVNALFVKPIK
jgi:hypothetical protein